MALNLFKSTTVGEVSGDDLMDNLADHIEKMYPGIIIGATTTSFSGNDVFAELPTEYEGKASTDYEFFALDWPVTIDGPASLAIGSAQYAPMLDAYGVALSSGQLIAGGFIILRRQPTGWYVLSGSVTGAGASDSNFASFGSDGTWTRPTGFSPDRMVTVELVGGGGAGSENGGGGAGGKFLSGRFRLGDMPSSVSVTIGQGGAPGATPTDGGATTFGTLLTAAGGLAAVDGSGIEATGGAGPGGRGADYPAGEGAGSVDQGGGGGGNSVHAPGTSALHGDGGADGLVGQVPGGGGGGDAAGAAGFCRVFL